MKLKMNVKQKAGGALTSLFNTLSGKKGYKAALFGSMSVLGVGAAIGLAAAALPLAAGILAGDAAIWAGISHLHARRNAKKKRLASSAKP
jgi:hypothetical protein